MVDEKFHDKSRRKKMLQYINEKIERKKIALKFSQE